MKTRGRVNLAALLAGRCPRCGRGAIFAPLLSGRPLRMHKSCPECGLDYEPEPGYFLGAMYVSYAFGVMTVLPVAMALVLVINASLVLTLAVAAVQTVLTALLMYRWSRIICSTSTRSWSRASGRTAALRTSPCQPDGKGLA